MATSVADVSSIVDSLSAPDVPSTPTPAPEPEVEPSTPAPDAAPETPESGSEPAPEPSEPGAEPAPEPGIDARTNPAAIRSALKALRDSDPKNAPIARQLNDVFGRWEAAKQVFPGGVTEMREVKAFLEANGGIEGLSSLHETIQSVNETDSLLYSGDPRVLDSIIEDLRSENKLDALTKLAGPYLEKLRGLDEKGYFEALKPHFYQGLVDTGVPNVIQQLAKVLSGDKPDIEAAKGLLAEFNNWINGLRDSVERSDRSKLDPERQKFEQERNDFQTQKQKEFQTGVATEAESHNNTTLGKALKPFLDKPYFKNIRANRDSMISLAREVKSSLMEELGADKAYRSQMDAFFAQKAPDKSRILQYHKSKVDTLATRIARQVIERRWPDYASKVGPAARPGAKPAAAAAQAAPQSGQPEYVKSKPEWESIDWSKDPGKMLFVTSKAYLKNGKFVYWGKPKK